MAIVGQFSGEGGIDISDTSQVQHIEPLDSSASPPSELNAGKRSRSTNSKDKMCPICGEAASKYVHYGARSCQPCRAFFRRSARRFQKSLR